MALATLDAPSAEAALMEGTPHRWLRQADGRYSLFDVPIAVAHRYHVVNTDGELIETQDYTGDRLARVAANANRQGGGSVHVGHKAGVLDSEGRLEGRAVNARMVNDALLVDYVDLRPAFFDDAIRQQGQPKRSIEFDRPDGDGFVGVAHLARGKAFSPLPRIRVDMTPEEIDMLQSDIAADRSYMAHRSAPADANRDAAAIAPQHLAVFETMMQERLAPLQAGVAKLTTDLASMMARMGTASAETAAAASRDDASKEIAGDAQAEKAEQAGMEAAAGAEQARETEDGAEETAAEVKEEAKEGEAETVLTIEQSKNERAAPDLDAVKAEIVAEAQKAVADAHAETVAFRSRLEAVIDPRVHGNAAARVQGILDKALAFSDPAARAAVVEAAETAYRSAAAPLGRLPQTIQPRDTQKVHTQTAAPGAKRDPAEFAKALFEDRKNRGAPLATQFTVEALTKQFQDRPELMDSFVINAR